MVCADRYEDFAIGVEGGVQATVGIETDETEVGAAAAVAVAGEHQFAVGLLDDAVALVIACAEVRGDYAVASGKRLGASLTGVVVIANDVGAMVPPKPSLTVKVKPSVASSPPIWSVGDESVGQYQPA